MRFLRAINWRFAAVFIVAFVVVLVGFLGVYAGFAAVHESNVKTTQVNTLIDQGHARDAEFEARDVAFNKTTDALTGDLSLVLGYAKTIVNRQDALLTYLRAHGIAIPKQFITEIPPPRLIYVPAKKTGGGSGHKPAKHRGGH